MLVAQIADQLGNQMFTYASVKSIAQKRGMDFRFIRSHNERINDTDRQYGNEIHTIFPNITDEFLTELPKEICHTYAEPPLKQRRSNYQKAAFQTEDNTLMIGHYISCQYFADNLPNVYTWFSFPQDIEDQVHAELKKLRESWPGRPLAAIHFRVGKDYMQQGFRIRDSYWFQAAEKILSENAVPPVFLLFYDHRQSEKDIINRFSQKYDCVICRGSLIHDLCMMSKCSIQVICNSSFSIMSAVLNQNANRQIYRPSVYPVGLGFQPLDCFAPEWTIIPARQSILSRWNCVLMHIKGKILTLLRKR